MTFDIKKKCISTISVLFLLLLTNTLTGQTLSVKIQNKTGHKIDSLVIGKTFVGSIEKDSTTSFIKFPSFRFDSGHPYESISGRLGKQRLKNQWWSMCGTERYTKEEGEYLFVLTIKVSKDQEYLRLD